MYPTLSKTGSAAAVERMMNILAYADGERDLIALAEQIQVPAEDCLPAIERLVKEQVMQRVA